MCVDDERNVLRALERIFLDDDYEIVLAGSGEEGLQAMEESSPFQVVISDYRMPVMNGVEFLKKVYDRWPETMRIVLSGYADASAIVAAINDGHIYRFIPKPWNDEELRVTIQSCVERYYLMKNNSELHDKLGEVNQGLEEQVQLRTKELELRNQALEFSQTLLSSLPIGVVGVDENGMIAYSNGVAAKLLKNVCSDIFGAQVTSNCDIAFQSLVKQVRQEKDIAITTNLSGFPCRVFGRAVDFGESEAVVLALVEVDA